MPDDPRPASRFPIGVGVALVAMLGLTTLSLTAAVAAVLIADDDVVTVGRDATSGITIEIELTEFAISPDPITIPPGGRLAVSNAGNVEHNLKVRDSGVTTTDLAAGAAETVDLGDLAPGTYEVWCDIAGHAEAGMVGVLTVEEGAEAPEGGHGGAEPDWEALDQAMMDSILAFPAETEGSGNQPLEPTIAQDGTKVFDLTAQITPWEVEPGRFVDAWTYNGQVPGPAIKVDVGDHVRINVHNELPMGTDVHWHGIRTPFAMDGVAPISQDLIWSGTDFTYEFTVDELAVGMYHAHHHAQMQVTNGMFGVFQVGDVPLPSGTIGGRDVPDDLDIAREIDMVLNDTGVIGYSLNGKSFPATEPYVLTEGDWVQVHYYNEGVQIHPMHQHQFPQLVIAKDGHPLDAPYWSDTVNVAPGERYTVLLHADDAGTWVWHCHILNHVERDEGMFGMVTALVVTEAT